MPERKALPPRIDIHDIPVFIISFNRLGCLRKQLEILAEYGLRNIRIIDNCSTYRPLLRFYNTCGYTVHRMQENFGHLALWRSRKFHDIIDNVPFILTDNDIFPDENCPKDFPELFYSILQGDDTLTKVGFGLRIDDLPEYYENRQAVVEWESQFWKEPYRDTPHFKAPIDTTFALYRPNVRPSEDIWWNSVRTGFPYVARHSPWYEHPGSEDEETAFYRKCILRSSSHWYGKV